MSAIHFKIEMFREYLEHELGILETIESWKGTCYFLDQLQERVKRFVADHTPMVPNPGDDMCADVEACQFANNRDEYFKGVSRVLEEMAGDVLEESAGNARYHFILGSMSRDIGQALRKLSGEILAQAK